MTRQEIVAKVTEIIQTVDGTPYYRSRDGGVLWLDYAVDLNEETVQNAAEEIADFITNLVRNNG